MSKIGKKPVLVPEGVEVKVEDSRVVITSSKGELLVDLVEGIGVEKKENQLIVSCSRKDRKTRSCFGTVRSLIQNAVFGLTTGWEKALEVVGTGFRVIKEGSELVFTLRFSHPVRVSVPENLEAVIEENKITIKGVDRQQVGLFAARLRKISPPDAYKGKGIRYFGEGIRLKPGKQVKSGSTG